MDTKLDARSAAQIEAAARTMHAQIAGDCRHQVGWDGIPAERRQFWLDRAAEVLAAADAVKA